MSAAGHVVVGAGIGGLTAALALQRHGFSVAVYEQSRVLGEVGAGVMLSPNASRVLIAFGLGEALARASFNPHFTAVRDGVTGELLSTAALGVSGRHADGSPFWHIHRADLHAVLLEAVLRNDPGCVHLDRTLVAVQQGGDGVVASFAGGHDVRCGVLIGADGVRSRVRQHVAGVASPQFTGNVAWRGIVPTAKLRPGICEPESTVWVGRSRHIVRYALRGGTVMNYVAIAERSAWTEEGWSVRSTVPDVLAEFEGWHPDVVEILAATPADACFKWGLFDRDPLEKWTDGRIALLGDAAHPMLPFMAQGAVMAIEDAAVLARMLAAHADVNEALAAYQHARQPRTSWVQLQSRKNARLYHDGSAGRQFDEDRALRAARLYDYDALHDTGAPST